MVKNVQQVFMVFLVGKWSFHPIIRGYVLKQRHFKRRKMLESTKLLKWLKVRIQKWGRLSHKSVKITKFTTQNSLRSQYSHFHKLNHTQMTKKQFKIIENIHEIWIIIKWFGFEKDLHIFNVLRILFSHFKCYWHR